MFLCYVYMRCSLCVCVCWGKGEGEGTRRRGGEDTSVMQHMRCSWVHTRYPNAVAYMVFKDWNNVLTFTAGKCLDC